jgi:hypothetical protein
MKTLRNQRKEIGEKILEILKTANNKPEALPNIMTELSVYADHLITNQEIN